MAKLESKMNHEKEIFFSIIVPVYNVNSYLDRCMKSLLNQDFLSYEVILVDDGSTDGSGEKCDSYLAYQKVRVIHKRNGGLSSARNAGLQVASGIYVMWIDSDDWIETYSLSKIYSVIQEVGEKVNGDEEEIDIVKYNYIRHSKEAISCYSIAKEGIYKGKENVDRLLYQALHFTGNYVLSACMHTYNREFLIKKGLEFLSEKEVASEDYLFNLEALLQARTVYVLKDPLYHYDLREGSLTQRYRERLAEQYTCLYREICLYCAQFEILEKYQEGISYFYIWSLIYGTGFMNEYTETNNHLMKDGRKKVKENLSLNEVQDAIRICARGKMKGKQRLQLYAMRLKLEPLFYWLFVIKPKYRRKRNRGWKNSE